MAQHMAQQLELDFSDITNLPLTYNANNTAPSFYSYTSNNTSPLSINSPPLNKNVHITADDVIFTKNGQTKSLFEMISKIEERLSILVPDPQKLEQFEALKRAYENYKTLEAICFTNNE